MQVTKMKDDDLKPFGKNLQAVKMTDPQIAKNYTERS